MATDGNKAAVDRLDDVAAGANGSKVVAKLVPAGEAAAQRLEKTGEPWGTRAPVNTLTVRGTAFAFRGVVNAA